MKRKFLSFVIVAGFVLAFGLPAFSQCSVAKSATFEYLDRLKDQADESVTVNMDRQLIDLALKFMPKSDPDAAKVRDAIQGIQSICVRSLEFKHDGAYQLSELDKMRKDLVGNGWMKIVEVRGKEDNVDVALHTDGDKILGVVIISAEARGLTVVNLVGTIKPEQLSDLADGHFAGIPHISDLDRKRTKRQRSESDEKPGGATKPAPKDE